MVTKELVEDINGELKKRHCIFRFKIINSSRGTAMLIVPACKSLISENQNIRWDKELLAIIRSYMRKNNIYGNLQFKNQLFWIKERKEGDIKE